jgi:hypothetical protein
MTRLKFDNMVHVHLNIPDKKYPAFIELLNSLDYVKKIEIENEPTKREILEGIKEAFEEMKLIKAGKLKARPIQELLDEL